MLAAVGACSPSPHTRTQATMPILHPPYGMPGYDLPAALASPHHRTTVYPSTCMRALYVRCRYNSICPDTHSQLFFTTNTINSSTPVYPFQDPAPGSHAVT